MSAFTWWRRSRVARILVVTAAGFIAFAAVLLFVVRRDISQTVSAEVRARVRTAAQVQHSFTSANGEAHLTADGKLAFGSSIANGDTSLVDRVKDITGADATVFQIVGGKPIRVATTLVQDDKRIIGTELKGQARAAFDKGQEYDGVTLILGKSYIAHYTIITDEQGKAIALFMNGVALDAVNQAIAQAFASILIVGLVAMAAVLLLVGAILRPLARNANSLARDAEALADGRVDDIRTLPGEDELGRVAASFARLVDYQRAVADVAGAIAEGDLTRSVAPASADDRLGHAVARMTENLREIVIALQASSSELAEQARGLDRAASRSAEIVGGVGLAVRELAHGSSDLSSAAETSNTIVHQFEGAIDGIARGALDQALQVRTASTDARRMAADVERVAAISADLAATGQQTRASAQSGANAVVATIEDMREIERGVSLAAQKIRELGELSSQIGVVVETIDTLTDQTNLLALNAAIEAARAGDHGRGFAVVADEVRKLAESSMQQTKQIGGLIVDVQRRTREAVEAADAGAATAERGSAKVGAASEALEGIIAAVDVTVERVGDIAVAMREMAGGARTVGGAMDSINSVVEQNSSATEEMAAQTGELARAMSAIAATADENARGTNAVSASALDMEDQVARVRGEAETLERTSARLRELVSRFRLERGSPLAVRPGAEPAPAEPAIPA
jgi:methyl-accepting chemotaxis protein